jgi:hypothetical protein
MTKYLVLLIESIIVLVLFSTSHAATVWTEQKGDFKQCKSAAGATKYHCITGTGCTPDTLKCVPPVVVPPPVCQAPKTGTYPDCGQCTEPNEGIYPACTLKKCTPPLVGTYPACAPPVVPPTSLMPFVDVTKHVVPAVGYSTLRIKPTSQQPETKEEGAFRVVCSVSHMNNDDPMVFPGQPNATHHHTYYGHTGIKYDTDLSTLSASGNSTCNGGIMNRTAYWHPTVVDTATNAPQIPDGGALFYYKVGYGVNPTQVKPPPKGLRMLAGNPKATNASESQATKFVCINKATQNSNGMPWQKTIPNCSTDTYMQMVVEHPSCWDGKNLDSPNHKDHMAYKNGTTCPSTHPVIIPVISLNMNFKVAFNGQMAKWRLSSDNYLWNGSNAGYSGHSDWVNGWDEPTMAGIVRNCLNQGKDAQAHLLCDGRMFE